jgi:hypothetical protein
MSQRSILIHSHLHLGLPSGLSTTKIVYACYIPCPAHSPRCHSKYTWQRVRIMKLLHIAVFFNRLSLHTTSVQIISAPPSQTPSVCIPPLMSETKFHAHTRPQAKLYGFYSNFCMFRQEIFWTDW